MNEVEQNLLFAVAALTMVGTLVVFVVAYFRRDR